MQDDATRLRNAEWTLESAGFRRCDIPACNCASWHQVGGFRARFDEIKEVIEGAGYSTNGRTLLNAVKALVADRDRAKELLAEIARDLGSMTASLNIQKHGADAK